MGVTVLVAMICRVAGQNIAFIALAALANYIYWYNIFQKLLSCYCETIVARNQRGSYFST